MTKWQRAFIETVWQHYHTAGRQDLPWRQTTDPYRILVSEMMLQQTQVDRVIPKYQAFIKQFPTFKKLATAPLSDVLTLWQGLGYNRRAKHLRECAKEVVSLYKGYLPADETVLRTLPGIGPYTARAVLAFAFNTGLPLIETNVRTVYIHHFFNAKEHVTDEKILRYIEVTLDRENPREWYYALMDYGSYLKRTVGNNTKQSKHYKKQSTFVGSDRQIRGAIIRYLTKTSHVSLVTLNKELTFPAGRIRVQLERLQADGLVTKIGRSYRLPA
jgi:A/G-specific adenine glycosylase